MFNIKRKIGHRIVFFGITLIIFTIGVITLLTVHSTMNDADLRSRKDLENRIKLMRLLIQEKGAVSVKDGLLMAGEYIISSNHNIVDSVSAIFGGTATIFQNDVRVSTNVIKDNGERAVDTRLTGIAYEKLFTEKTFFTGEVTFLGNDYYTRYEPLTDSTGNIVGALYAGVMASEYHKNLESIALRILILSLILIVVGSIATYIFGNRIAQIINTVSAFSNSLSQGELRTELSISRHDELGSMSRDLNRMKDILNVTVSEIANISQSLSSSSEQLAAASDNFASTAQAGAASSEEISSTIEELTAGMENIADNTDKQKQLIDSLIARLEEFSQNALATQKMIEETKDLAAKINTEASAGEKRLDVMINTMNEISSASSEMLDITTIINDISDQINLLSLNAAIEAARAGDSGRGFAVVADEISKLAYETSNSIKNIDGLIKRTNSGIAGGLTQVSETVKSIGKIVDGIENINGMMEKQIVFVGRLDESRIKVEEDAVHVVEKAELIKNATKEQELAANEIVSTVGNIAELSQTIASGAEELSASSHTIEKMAENLQARLDFFKI